MKGNEKEEEEEEEEEEEDVMKMYKCSTGITIIIIDVEKKQNEQIHVEVVLANTSVTHHASRWVCRNDNGEKGQKQDYFSQQSILLTSYIAVQNFLILVVNLSTGVINFGIIDA